MTSAALLNAVKSELASSLAEYGLTLARISTDRVLLRGSSYVLSFFVDREGVYLLYFDLATENRSGYNLYLFLFERRYRQLAEPRPRDPSEKNDRVRLEVEALVRHLVTAGEDILSGGKEWIKEYQWPPIDPTSLEADL
jgi:hypothetical protein